MNNSYRFGFILAVTLSITACQQTAINEHESVSAPQKEFTDTQVQEAKITQLLKKLTLEEKVSLTHASGTFFVNAIPRLHIPELWMSDGPHGVRHQMEKYGWGDANRTDDFATYLPNLTSVAASWDVNMATLHGSVLGSEARARQKDIILGPGVNIARLPLNGRNFEYMGEDPFLVSTLVVPEVIAIQKNDVSANVKHFALNSQELNRDSVNAKPDERTLREVYLPAFEAAVKKGHVHSLMGAYNQYYGSNVNQSAHLVKDILKGEWGFDGVLLTDWNVDINTYDAAMNGLDIEMGTNVDSYEDYFFGKPLLARIKAGKIPEAVLNDKVRRILRLQVNIGALDLDKALGNNEQSKRVRKAGELNTDAHHITALTIAENGVVLLKNDPVGGQKLLPLSVKNLKNILIMGPNANKKHGSGGGSSEVKSSYEITPLQGLKNQLGDQVNIQVMRARSGDLTSIAPDYVVSRHWTGTPAWNMTFYDDEKHLQVHSKSWSANSSFTYQKGDKNKTEHLMMTAKVKPLSDGVHQLKIASIGKFKLFIDKKLVANIQDEGKETKSINVTLNAQQEYDFNIIYDGNEHFTLGWNAPSDLFTDEETYLTAAKKADAVIYFAGLTHSDDRESLDRVSMKLPDNQDEVISKLLTVNPNTIVFMIAGSAVEMPWIEQAHALVWGWYAGMEAGNAFANILTGKVSPSGKMPITLPVRLQDSAAIALNDYNGTEMLYKEGVFVGYRWFEQQNIQPLFEFGYGLSYSEFSYSNMQLSSAEMVGDETITVTADITNTGNVAAAEVVQLYLHDEQASVERPIKELKGFTKVYLKPQETKKISLTLTKRDLSFWDVNSKGWLAESGKFDVMLAASLNDIKTTKTFNYNKG